MPWTAVAGWDATAIRALTLPAPGKIVGLVWPLILGGFLGVAMVWTGRRPPPIPPGDGIVWLAALGRRGMAPAERGIACVIVVCSGPGVPAAPWGSSLQTLRRWGQVGEAGARREAELIFLVLVVLIAGLLLW